MTRATRAPRVRTDVSIEVEAELERRQAEAFVLEVRALAKRYGLEVETAQPPR
ncbi:MAG TPA: hypothetical protein VEA38_02800 [Terriglobales bacterium]|nr:hypothetical protein [Terriglobales bacterium]